MNFDLDSLLHIVQIAFYITIATIGILTYLKAKKTLLNSVHIEYQKISLQRIRDVSEEMETWFDHNSDNHWVKREETAKKGKLISSYFLDRDELDYSVNEIKEIVNDSNLKRIIYRLYNIESDPFIPRHLRELIVNNFRDDMIKISKLEQEAIEDYQKEWIKYKDQNGSKLPMPLEKRFFRILIDNDIYYWYIEQRLHIVRRAVQNHYSKYDPFK